MMSIERKLAAFRDFWSGKGPSLILIPATKAPQYDTDNYAERFENPALMWEAEMRRARAIADWPTDGIPAVRPNLGVIFVPGCVGQDYRVQPGQMPWPGRPLSRDAIRELPCRDLESSKMMQLAVGFYQVHRERGNGQAIAYHPDTQGVFSLAHLFYGDQIFYDLVEDTGWVRELLEITLSIHTRVVRLIKSCIGEPVDSMAHGHSFPNGVWFPHAGVRISEDTATMVSPRMIGEFVVSYTGRAVAPFGGCFVHYCGRHEFLFQEVCRLPQVRAIDLGNPEMYDTRWLLENCSRTGTVFFGPVPPQAGEQWRDYLRRTVSLVKDTGARLILRPTVFPDTREECAEMQDLWHELT